MNEVLNLKLESFSSQHRVWHPGIRNGLLSLYFIPVLLRIGTFLVEICKTKGNCDEEEIQLTTCIGTNIFTHTTTSVCNYEQFVFMKRQLKAENVPWTVHVKTFVCHFRNRYK